MQFQKFQNLKLSIHSLEKNQEQIINNYFLEKCDMTVQRLETCCFSLNIKISYKIQELTKDENLSFKLHIIDNLKDHFSL